MTQNSPEFWAQSAQQFQQTLGDSWSKAFQSFQNMDLGSATAGVAGAPSMPPAINFSPTKLQELQQQYIKEAAALWTQGVGGSAQSSDKRFSAEAWGSNPLAAFSAAAYLLNTRTLMGMADAVEADAKTRARIRFAVEQMTAAAAPSNFMAFNAEAQKKAIETKGESIAKGVQNLLHDMRQGHVSMTDESVFEVGKNVATTEGAVVFENDLKWPAWEQFWFSSHEEVADDLAWLNDYELARTCCALELPLLTGIGHERDSGLLDEVAQLYTNDVQYDLKTLAQQIEPVLIVFLGVLVLVLALGVFLPVWDLGRVALKH